MNKKSIPVLLKHLTLGLLLVLVCVTIALSSGATSYAQGPVRADPSSKLPTDPLGALKFRKLSLVNEKGVIPHNALRKAYRHVKRMRKAQAKNHAPEASALAWTWLGPGNVGGRVRGLVIDPNTPANMWAGSVSGGIWKTTNGGTSWAPVDDFMLNLSISSIIIDPTNTSVMYAGTGEGFGNYDAIRGAGIFKSTDAGVTWNQLTATNTSDFYYVNRLAISPDGATILAATNSGIWQSTTGGTTWTQETFNQTLFVEFHPSDSTRAIASGTSFGQYTTDSGGTWNNATGLPSGRAELAYAPSAPTTVYAAVDNNSGEFYKSTNGGQTYSAVNTGNSLLGGQAWYNNAVWVDPTNVNTVVIGGTPILRSTNGGTNFTDITGIHADDHIIINAPGFNGSSNKTVYVGNDGGVFKTDDIYAASSGSGWTELNNNLGITQFLGIVGNNNTGVVIGGTQDNGTNKYNGGTETWSSTFGGDGGFVDSDPTDNNYYYGEYVNLNVFRSTDAAVSAEYISGQYWNGSNYVWKSAPYLIQDAMDGTPNFIAPFILDPNNADRLLAGGVSLWRTNDVKTANTNTTGPTWATIKAPIAGNDPISAVAVAKGNSDIIWVGHNGGNLYMTTNGTAGSPTWTRRDNTSPSLPNRFITRIAIDPNNANIVYVTFGGFNSDNVWRTTDAGANWTQVTGTGASSLPAAPVRSIVISPSDSKYLSVGTEVGVFVSGNSGLTWHVPQDGPANVSVDELRYMGSTLLAGTHGRGAFSALPVSGDVGVSKTDSPDPVLAGANLTYTINVTNFGPTNAADVAIAESTPTNTTFSSITAPNGWSCTTPAVGGTGAVTCSRSDMPVTVDTIYFTVKVNSNTANGSTISNTVTVSSSTTDTNSGNNTSSTDTLVANNADLSITKTASPDPAVLAGNDLTYSILVKNNGPTDAATLTMDDTVSAPVTFVSITPAGGWACPTTPSVGASGAIQCTKATMTAGESGTFTLVVHVPSSVVNGTNLSNTATIGGGGTDPNPDNNTSLKTTLVQTQADLQITKTASPDPVVIAGTDLTYTVTIKNNGPSDSQSIKIDDKLPTYTVFKSLTPEPTGWVCSKPLVGDPGTVSCTGISVPASATLVWTLVVHVLPSAPDNTVLTNDGIVTLATTDPNLSNNDTGAINTTVHTQAVITITKTATPSPNVIAGTDITYKIVLHNTGPSDAQNVDLNDPLPTNTTFTSLTSPAGWICTTPPVNTNGTVDCTESPMPFDQVATFSIVAHVLSSTPVSGPQLCDTATITWSDHTPGDNTANSQACDNVQTKASLAVVKTSVITGVAGAGTITYTIAITNNGPSDQLNVVMTDPLDPTITQVSATADSGGLCSGDPLVTCNWADVTNGQTVQVVIVASLNPDALNLCNTATATWTDSFAPFPHTTFDKICETVPTQAEASITMDAKRVGTGRTIEYTIVVHTDGPSVDRNVRVPDKLAKSTTFVRASTTVGSCKNQATKQRVLCTLGDLWPGTTVTIVIRVKIVKSVPAIKNTVTIQQDTYDSNLDNNSASTNIPTGGGNNSPGPNSNQSSSLIPKQERLRLL